ncbi:MAG: M20 family metallopeptidase [Planctomycetota bacterium]|jgi:succinyl-diaminopimelate desuccinylase
MKELLKKLIKAETTAEIGELAAAEVISADFERLGMDTTIDSWGPDRANVVVRVESSGRKAGLLFACHLDVVGPGKAKWEHQPFSAEEKDGKIYGRGAADMKGGITAAVTAIRQIIDSGVELGGDIVFLGVGGEETDSCGAKRFMESLGKKLPELAGVVIPEPTDFDVVTAHRGMLWLKVVVRGKAAHGSAPEMGVNAITSMKAFLNELDNYEIEFTPHELLGGCSMSVNTIAGGKEINIIPDECEVGIDIRTLPGQDCQAVIDDLKKIFAKLKRENPQFEASVSIVREVEALETNNESDFVRDFCSIVGASETKAVGFTTDGPHFGQLGAPVVIFGPGKPELCHKPDEYIDIADVEKAVEYYKDIILKLLA